MAVLDTSTLLDLFRAKPNSHTGEAWGVVRRLVAEGSALLTTRFNLLELYVGEIKSTRPEAEVAMIDRIKKSMAVLEFDDRAARLFARHDVDLRRAGRPLDDMDLLIGSVALAYGVPVVTRNPRHFEAIRGLEVLSY